MRIITLLIFFITLNTFSSNAQEKYSGIKLGPNMATIGRGFEYEGIKVGVQAGIFSTIMLSNTFSLKPELLISNQGARSNTSEMLSLNTWYLNLPLLLQYSMEKSGTLLSFGSQIGTPFYSRIKYIDSGQKGNAITQLNGFNLSLVAALGIPISERLVFESRLNFGISNISRITILEEEKFYNRVLQMSFEYIFKK